jgi:hypothetical protein
VLHAHERHQGVERRAGTQSGQGAHVLPDSSYHRVRNVRSEKIGRSSLVGRELDEAFDQAGTEKLCVAAALTQPFAEVYEPVDVYSGAVRSHAAKWKRNVCALGDHFHHLCEAVIRDSR